MLNGIRSSWPDVRCGFSGPGFMPGFFVLLEATSPRLSRPANDYFQIPTGRVVEVGTQVTIHTRDNVT
jgi:hypothetical protein